MMLADTELILHMTTKLHTYLLSWSKEFRQIKYLSKFFSKNVTFTNFKHENLLLVHTFLAS